MPFHHESQQTSVVSTYPFMDLTEDGEPDLDILQCDGNWLVAMNTFRAVVFNTRTKQFQSWLKIPKGFAFMTVGQFLRVV